MSPGILSLKGGTLGEQDVCVTEKDRLLKSPSGV